jgi:hypothetical protein
MRRQLFLIAWCLLAFSATAGTLPELKEKPTRKKQPQESLHQPMDLQTENIPAPDTRREDDPKAVAAALRLPEREAHIAGHYLSLANATGGSYYPALERPLLNVLEELLQEQLVKGADIVFVIDHTSSMEDDIEEIRTEIQRLISQFEAQGGIRAGIVTFSDVKSGSKYGYCPYGLTEDYKGLSDFLGSIELLGSVEDIYGAIWKAVDEFKWKSKTKRLIVLISDDKPASGKDTNYTEEDVIVKCAQAGVKTNLYPILVDKYSPVKQ